MTEKVYFSHDGGVDVLAYEEQGLIELVGGGVVPADPYLEPAVAATRKIINRFSTHHDLKDILLEKKVLGIADTILNVIFLLCAVMIVIYMMIENKLTSDNSFYIILTILVVIHTSFDLSLIHI